MVWLYIEERISDCNRKKVPAGFVHSHSFFRIMSKYPTADPRQSF